jgi:hypothetical protein
VQRDAVNNWLWLPAIARVLLGLTVPLALSLWKPW